MTLKGLRHQRVGQSPRWGLQPRPQVCFCKITSDVVKVVISSEATLFPSHPHWRVSLPNIVHQKPWQQCRQVKNRFCLPNFKSNGSIVMWRCEVMPESSGPAKIEIWSNLLLMTQHLWRLEQTVLFNHWQLSSSVGRFSHFSGDSCVIFRYEAHFSKLGLITSCIILTHGGVIDCVTWPLPLFSCCGIVCGPIFFGAEQQLFLCLLVCLYP